MADIRDPNAFMRGRWRWNGNGYEAALPGRLGVGDVDGFTEYKRHHLFIEAKHWTDGRPLSFQLAYGQRIAYESLVSSYDGNRLLLLLGDAPENNPGGAQVWQMVEGSITRHEYDWRALTVDQRRAALRDRFAAFVKWVDNRTAGGPA